ncbi:MAG: MFS transporter [Defluviitaleaceae bacterium]|nr:MFS transporter [Defluviitaleaceae bacterium]
MITLLVIILATFASSSLQFSLLGSAWPVIYSDLGVPIGNAGIIAMISAISAVMGAFLSDKIGQRFNTGLILVACMTATSLALLGFSFSYSFVALCVFAVPLGFGGGMIDSVLNNFVALHYKAKHMNWLHSFWGLGALIGPLIMATAIDFGSWSWGYIAISALQFTMVLILLGSLPLWRKFVKMEQDKRNVDFAKLHETAENLGKSGENSAKSAAKPANPEKSQKNKTSKKQAIALPGAKFALLTFLFYCSIEAVVDLWSSTYLVTNRAIAPEVAARFLSLYYLGITAGRFTAGFLTEKFTSRQLIHFGQTLIAIGVFSLFLPLPETFAAGSLLLIGLGCAPIFPCLMHETSKNFAREHSQTLVSLQVTFAYMGNTFAPPLFGLVGQLLGYWIFPNFVAGLLTIIVITVVVMYRRVGKRSEVV